MVCQFLAHCSIAVREMDNLKLFSYYEFVNTKIIPNLSRSVYLEKNLKFLVLKNNRETRFFFFKKKKRILQRIRQTRKKVFVTDRRCQD